MCSGEDECVMVQPGLSLQPGRCRHLRRYCRRRRCGARPPAAFHQLQLHCRLIGRCDGCLHPRHMHHQRGKQHQVAAAARRAGRRPLCSLLSPAARTLTVSCRLVLPRAAGAANCWTLQHSETVCQVREAGGWRIAQAMGWKGRRAAAWPPSLTSAWLPALGGPQPRCSASPLLPASLTTRES